LRLVQALQETFFRGELTVSILSLQVWM